MKTVNMHEAKTHLSRLVEEVLGGETVIIANRGRAVARLSAISADPTATPRRTGFLEGVFTVPSDFDQMDDTRIARSFTGQE